jgi:hypothetical protein
MVVLKNSRESSPSGPSGPITKVKGMSSTPAHALKMVRSSAAAGSSDYDFEGGSIRTGTQIRHFKK